MSAAPTPFTLEVTITVSTVLVTDFSLETNPWDGFPTLDLADLDPWGMANGPTWAQDWELDIYVLGSHSHGNQWVHYQDWKDLDCWRYIDTRYWASPDTYTLKPIKKPEKTHSTSGPEMAKTPTIG
ncbi:hypothetical protein FRC11_001254 [Ceratobasidium sp. 423]|nr:hypothetical protein FRC11_001254 [Ceratobasidium sp. 423]